MTLKNCTYLLMALFSVGGPAAAAEIDSPAVCISSCQDDSAVSSLLLAAGMYGGIDGRTSQEGVDLSWARYRNMLKGAFPGQGQLDGQDITLSYKGSSGRLGFSAGYIYTAAEQQGSRDAGTVLLGFEPPHRNAFSEGSEKPWYVTVNISRSFQLDDDIALGVGSKTMFLSPSLNDKDSNGQALCMSLNLPVSYKGFLTITPELQWSRAILNEENDQASVVSTDMFPADKQNSFYGGMSISLSY